MIGYVQGQKVIPEKNNRAVMYMPESGTGKSSRKKEIKDHTSKSCLKSYFDPLRNLQKSASSMSCMTDKQINLRQSRF